MDKWAARCFPNAKLLGPRASQVDLDFRQTGLPGGAVLGTQ